MRARIIVVILGVLGVAGVIFGLRVMGAARPPIPSATLSAVEQFFDLRLPDDLRDIQLRLEPFQHGAVIFIIAEIKGSIDVHGLCATWNLTPGATPRIDPPVEGTLRDWLTHLAPGDSVFYEEFPGEGYRTLVLRPGSNGTDRLFLTCQTSERRFPGELRRLLECGAVIWRGYEFKGVATTANVTYKTGGPGS